MLKFNMTLQKLKKKNEKVKQTIQTYLGRIES